jgi:hypothetical protein
LAGIKGHPIALGILNKELEMPRTLIEPHKGDKRFVRRKKGKFTSKQVNVGRSLAADRRSKSKTIAKKGERDRVRGGLPPDLLEGLILRVRGGRRAIDALYV